MKGALPDPNWLPTSPELLDSDGLMPDPAENETASHQRMASQDVNGPEQLAPSTGSRPKPCFREGDSVTNNSGTRCGLIGDEPPRWVAASRLDSSELLAGHWSYAVAWDGQMGFTINYAEDLLRHADAKADQGEVG